MAEVEPIRDFEDVKRMYNWLKVHASPREAECWLIGCNLALRAGDLLQLKFSQMSENHVTIIEQKTGKKKQFPVNKEVRQALVRLLAYYKSKNFKPTYLFQSTSNRMKGQRKPICIQWLGKALKKASWDLELGYNVNTHTMRKTWGFQAYERGEDIHHIQALFNHATSKVTLRYIGVTKRTIENMYHTNALEIA
ncbi:site-specific integrase [Maricurvus nonylphenolicus]|uniref:tyrosine-type recombinase/integrase n=1 Tax=Maricurvus nonylphenolicus TaxID=1008307 RepID=UPI0036F30429